MKVAIFDFDGTLYADETFKLLMNHLKEHPIYHTKYKRFYRAITPMYIAYKIKLYPQSKMKEKSMQLYLNAFDGFSTVQMDAYFEEFKEKIKSGINEEVIKRLYQHQKENIHILLVSGAYTQFLHRVTDGISFDHIIGSNITFKNDKIDINTPILHINGTRKTDHILNTLKDIEVDWENSYAYGDSFSDLPVLELVGNPVAVRPEEKLRNVAKERGWEII